MPTAGRRGALRALIMTGAGALWVACRRATGQGADAVPTLANVGHIRATYTAEAAESPVEEPPDSETTPSPLVGVSPEPTRLSETAAPVSGGTAWPSVVRGPQGILVTSPIERFYETRYRNANPRPEIDVADWHLTIEGAVQYPLALTFEDILALPQVEVMRTLECISNPVGGTLIGNTLWRGVRLADVLALVQVRSGGRELKMTAADGYETSIPLDLATHPDALLVYEMDGAPLSIKHGYPLRVLLPGRYGQKQPKWITKMEVIPDEFLGYWEQRGWSNDAKVQVNSQIWQPAPLSSLSGDSVEISGIAYADDSGVATVEVSTDGGITWNPAELVQGPTTLIWTEWRYNWQIPAVAERRSFALAVRATDGNGTTQRRVPIEAGILDSTYPDGTSVVHSIVVTVEPSS